MLLGESIPRQQRSRFMFLMASATMCSQLVISRKALFIILFYFLYYNKTCQSWLTKSIFDIESRNLEVILIINHKKYLHMKYWKQYSLNILNTYRREEKETLLIEGRKIHRGQRLRAQ